MALDILIQGATIVDGTGRPRYQGDIAIKEGSIVAVGKTAESASRVVNAAGLVAAPGFWDVHTHYDAQLLWDPLASSSVWHGTTSIVIGNCGFGIAPVRPEDQEYTVRSLARVEGMDQAALMETLPWTFESFGDYLDLLDGNVGINVMAMVGHSAVRRYVLGPEASQREADEEEVETMRRIVAEALRAGGFGFTSSRSRTHWDGEGQPVPSRLATTDELKTLACQMKGIKCGFIHGIGDSAFSQELTEIMGRPYLYPPLTQVVTEEPDAWKGKLDDVQREIETGRTFGMAPVNRRQFEMSFDNTNVFDRWMEWQKLMTEPVPARMVMMRDPDLRDRLRREMEHDPLPVLPFDWSLVTLVESPTGRWQRLVGKTAPEIADELGKDPLDSILDIALDEELKSHFTVRDTRYPNEDILPEILKAPHMVIGMSDSGAHGLTQVDTGFPTHLLGYWGRERGLITIEEAVNILSARPADEVGITDRGRLLPGQAADIVLFDLDKVMDGERVFQSDLPGGSRRLVQYASGIESVMVNGVVVRQGDQDTGDLGGRLLRSTWE